MFGSYNRIYMLMYEDWLLPFDWYICCLAIVATCVLFLAANKFDKAVNTYEPIINPFCLFLLLLLLTLPLIFLLYY